MTNKLFLGRSEKYGGGDEWLFPLRIPQQSHAMCDYRRIGDTSPDSPFLSIGMGAEKGNATLTKP
jgi:hypothetical protein